MRCFEFNVFREDDSKWPEKNRDGRQELEIRMGNEHISFEVRDLLSTKAINLANPIIDCEDWLSCRCHRIVGSRRLKGVLLPRPGSKGSSILADIFTLQSTFKGL